MLTILSLVMPSGLAFAATGAPRILNYQGRLMDSSGTLLGGAGTNYCFKFSLYDDPTVGSGTKVWPSGSPSTMTAVVKNGVFSVGVGDTNAGGDLLDYDFQTSDTVYLNVEVATKVGPTCAPGDGAESFENLEPRNRIDSSGYAINANTVGGFAPAQAASGNQVPVLSADQLLLGGLNAGVSATNTAALTIQGNSSGDINFFSASNKLTSAGDLTLAGLLTSDRISFVHGTSTSIFTSLIAASAAAFGATATSTFDSAGNLTLAGGLTGPLQAANGAVSATSSIGVSYGGTGISTIPTFGQLLLGTAAGGYSLAATSTLGLPTFSNLASYLSLSAWYATTTDALAEGSSNQYFTVDRVSAVLAGTTTDQLAEGTNHLYYTDARATSNFISNLAATTSISSITTLANLVLPATQLSGFGIPFYQYFSATTTDALTEGSTHRYYSSTLFSQDLAATTSVNSIVTLNSLVLPASQVSGFDTAVNTYLNSSTTVAKTYADNTFAGTQTFQNASTTNISATYASSTRAAFGTATTTNLAVTGLSSSLLKVNALGQVGAASAGVDFLAPSALSGYLALSDWYSTTTDQLKEGTTNQYFTTARATTSFVGNLAATTSVSSITALPNLSIASSQVTGLFGYLFPGNATTTKLSFDGGLSTTYASSTGISSSYASSTQGFFGSLSVGSLTGLLRASAGAIVTGAVNLASEVSGVLSVANGGTGWAAIQAGSIPYGNGAGALATTSAGTAGQVLALLNGVPTWTSTTTFAYPLSYSAGIVNLAFGTTTNNIWSGTNTFNGNVTATNATSTSLFSQWISALNGNIGTLTASTSAVLASTTAQGQFIAGSIISTSTATSSFAGPLAVGIANPSYQVSILGSTTAPTSATGTAVLAVTNDNNTLSSGTNLLRLNLRTAYGTTCVTGTTCPRFIEYFAGVGAGKDTGGRGVGSLRLSTAGTGITQTSGSADFAEFMQLNAAAAAGDIVSLNAQGEYQKAVAGQSIVGVVSENPAFVGNANIEGQANAYIVGFAGVVPTTVSTVNGAINAGDFIGASTTAGVGVKLTESGYALGQALQPFSGPGTGQINVLVAPKFIDGPVALASYGIQAGGITGYWNLSTTTGQVSLASSTYSLMVDKLTTTYASSTGISSSYASSTQGFFGSLSVGSLSGILKASGGAVTAAAVNLASDVSGFLGIASGGTGTSTAPAYGQLLIGNALGGFDYVATSSLGINSGVWGSITGSIAAQTDLQNALAAKLNLSDWYSTTTSDIEEGSNLYFTTARATTSFVGNLAATTSVASITTLPSLSLPATQLSGFGIPFYTFFHATTSDALTEGSTNLFFNATRATDSFIANLAATTSISSITALPNLSVTASQVSDFAAAAASSFVSNLAGTSSVASITTLPNLSLPYSQITGAPTSLASSTLLSDSNTFTGTNTFTSPISGSVTGNAGTVTNGVYTTTFNGLFDSRFTTDLAATTSISSITTLANLVLPATQLSGFGVPFFQYFSATTTDALTEGSTHRYYSSTLFSQDLAATTSVNSIVTLNNLLLPAGQVSGLNAAIDSEANSYIAASTTIPKTYADNTFAGTQTFQNASTTNISATYASSTRAAFGTATTTSLAITGLSSSLLKVNALGQVGAASAGVDFLAPSALSGYLALSDWYSTTTSDIEEGSNLYFTTARATTSFVGNLAATTSVASITALPNLSIASSQVTGLFGYLFPGNATTTGLGIYASTTIGNGTATGGLTVAGTATTSDLVTTGSVRFGGLLGGALATNALGQLYTYSTSTWRFASSTLLSDANYFSGANTFAQTITGSVSGNAGTATKFQTARAINGVSFDGTADITVASTSLLSDSNTFTGKNVFANATTTLLTAPTAWITKLANLASAGFVKTAADGTLSVDTNTYLTSAITGIGPVGQSQSGPAITLATSSTAYNGLTASTTITGSGNTLTFANTLSGTLGVAGGGTGASSFSYGLLGSLGGTGALVNFATSSLGLLSTNVAEGSNLYYQDSRVNTYLQSSTTVAKTYAANTFTNTNTFNGQTNLAYASSTGISSAYASSTQGFFGSLSVGNLTGLLRASAGAIVTGAVNLASEVSGVLSVANGGTGWAAIQAGSIPYGNGAGALATTSAGTAGQVLALLNGVPTWTSTTTFAYPLSYSAGIVNLAFGTTTNNIWSGTNTFNGQTTLATASSTAVSSLDYVTVGRTATTTIRGEATATSTFAGGVQANAINVTSTTASSTFANGIDLANGCFAVNGTCISAGGGGMGANLVNIQAFTAGGTYTPSPGAASAYVIVTGGGGGGGGADGTDTTNETVAGGGGAGGTSLAFVDLTSVTTVTVTVGTGGSGGLNTGTNGSTGNPSSFGTYAAANGGAGGVGSAVNATGCAAQGGIGAGGVGGTASLGDINYSGGAGNVGACAAEAVQGGTGGASYWGGGGRGAADPNGNLGVAGSAGASYGSGGGGAADEDSTTGAAGGAGADGIVVVYEYGPFDGVMKVTNGGTGTTTAPSYGQVLVGNASGGYDLVATSSLGISGGSSGNPFPGDATTTQLSFNGGLTASRSTTTAATSTNSFSGNANASTASFGATATSSFASNGALTLAQALTVGSGGTGASSFSYGLLGSLGGTGALVNFATSSLGLLSTNVAEGSNLYYQDSRVNTYLQSSTTVAKTYAANTFTNTNTFNGQTNLAYASSTGISSSYASSTQGFFGSLSVGNLTGLLRASAGAIVTGAVNLASEVSGVLSVANGGTGWANIQANTLLTGNGTGAVATTSVGSSLQISGGTLSLNLGNANIWTGLQTFSQSSTTIVSAYRAYFGGTATTSIDTAGNVVVGGSLTSMAAGGTYLASTSATRLTVGAATSTNATTTTLYISGGLTGAGLSTCSNGTTDKLLWNSTTGQFSCGTDAGAGSGIANLGAAGQLQNGASQTFATSSDANIGLTITSAANTHTFTTIWNGILSVARGGTGWGNIQAGTLLTGNGTGAVATTSIGSSLQISGSTLSLNLSSANTWTGLQVFGNASSTLLETVSQWARTIQSTSTNALVLKTSLTATAGLTLGSTSTPQMFALDTLNNRATIGTGGSSPTLLVVDSKNTTGDPTGINGATYYNSSDSLWRCYANGWRTCGGQAASSTGAVQVRGYDGGFGGTDNFAWNFLTNGLVIKATSSAQTTDLFTIASSTGSSMFSISSQGVLEFATTTDPTPNAGILQIFAKDLGGRVMPKWQGPSGLDTAMQPFFATNNVSMIGPGSGSTATTYVATVGAPQFSASIGTGGTFTVVTPTSGSLLNQTRRFQLGSAAGTANTGVYIKHGSAAGTNPHYVWRGDTAGLGGFFFLARFGKGAIAATSFDYLGLYTTPTVAPTSVDPTTNTTYGKIGIAHSGNTGNWKIVSNIAGSAVTAIDLGASFAINTTDLLEVILFAAPNDSKVSYRVKNLSTGAETSGVITSPLPTNTTFMGMVAWSTNGGTAAANNLQIARLYLETDY